jgi:uncharacterized protein (TIGR03437 family)
LSERQRWFGIFVAKAILVCGCAPFALYGQYPTATWTGMGNDGSWANGNNWTWDNSQCNDPTGVAYPPATFYQGSPCYTANVVIGAGVTVDEDEDGMSAINNFSLGAGSTLMGAANGTGDTMIGLGAIVSGGASAGSSSGVLSNQGAIFGSVSGATVTNTKDGIIHASGQYASVIAHTQGTNAGTIEATGPGTLLGGTGTVSLSGPWNNTGGTIQIDSGTVLSCDATITNGNLINNGGSVGGAGDGLRIAGVVNSTTLTIDAAGGATTVTVTGTLINTGTLIVGQTSGVSTLKLTNGGILQENNGITILGAQGIAAGQMIIVGKSTQTIGNLTIGQAGSGLVSVSGGATLIAGLIAIGSQPSASGQGGQLDVQPGGTVDYGVLHAYHDSTTYGTAVYVEANGTLTGATNLAAPSDILSATAEVYGSWKVGSGLAVRGGALNLWSGGTLDVSCTYSCGTPGVVPSGPLQATGTSAIIVSGTGALLTTKGLFMGSKAALVLQDGCKPDLGILSSFGKVTVNTGSQMTASNVVIYAGTLTVENQGTLTASELSLSFSLNGSAQFTAVSGGTISVNLLSATSGSGLIQGGVLNMTGFTPSIFVGGGFSSGALTFSGAGDNAGKLNGTPSMVDVFSGGTLTIDGGDSVTIPGLIPRVSLPGGTINVEQGELIIGNAVSAGQGWVTVGILGTLSGGKICEAGNPCVQDTLFNGPGHVAGKVSNRGGIVSISDPTTLNITQDFQQSSGTLDLEIQGTQPAQYDQLLAGGSIQITGGTVKFDFGNGFAPDSGDKFNLLSAPGGVSVSGASFTTTGLASGFNSTTSISSSQFDLTATTSGTATTSAAPPPPKPTLTSVDTASGAMPLAPGSLASGYGNGLATGQPATAPFPWPTTLEGTSVAIVDLTGVTTQAPLLYVSSTLVDYQIPNTVLLGPATVTVTAGDGTTKSGPVNIVPYAPGLFAVNTAGLAASFADCVAADGTQTTILTSQVVNGALVAVPLNLKACQETVLELWATGLDAADASIVQATIGGLVATVLYAGPQGVYPGVDQVNVVIPQSLAGAGNVPVVVSIGGVTSNTVTVTIQ